MSQTRLFPKTALKKTFLMFDRRFFACVLHIIIIASVLELFKFTFPVYVSQLAHLTFVLLLSHFTYDFSKNAYLTEEIQPENKAVFITGCDTGFGHLLARRLDSKGFHVFAGCLFPLGDGASKLKENCSERLQILGLDVTKDDSVQEALNFVKKQLAPCELWAIVNNAGIQNGFDIEFSSMADFKRTMEVNAFGVVRVTKAFLPLLQKFKGRIINVTSLNGRVSFARIGPYLMSKYAATAFTECIRQEMDVWNLKVIAVEPELFATPMTESKLMNQHFETMLSNLDKETKRKYGEEFFPKYSKFIRDFAQLGGKKIDPVIDDLEMAVSLKYPDSVYKPRRNFWARIVVYFLETMPQKLLDIIVSAVGDIFGLPTPKEANRTQKMD